MKKLYEELELEVIRFGAEDVITASTEETDDNTDDNTTDDNTGTRDGGGDDATDDPGKEVPADPPVVS